MQLLTKQEVADMLQVSPSTVDRLRHAGYLRSLKVNGQVRFDPQDVQTYIDCQATGGLSPGERLYRPLRPDEPPPFNSVEAETHRGQVPADLAFFRGRWECLLSACPARYVRIDVDYGDRPLPRRQPAVRCPVCGKGMRFGCYLEVESLVPAGPPAEG